MDDVEEAVTNGFVEFITTYQVPLRILVIVLVASVLHWVLRTVLKRTINRVVMGVKKAQDVEHTQELSLSPKTNARAVQRARALGGIGRSVISWTVVTIAVVMILGQLGFNMSAVFASAGVLAAALAFGAQNIVKDLLNGLFMVFEDQLGVGDWITIGEVSGTVEDVGIRITQVRSVDGTLWFVRNGEILTLGNASQGWGRALVDLAVAADNDFAGVERVALEAAKNLLSSPQFSRKVTGEPEVWGLESISGDQATIRIAIRTRPEAQWAVQRELRSLLSRAFHEAGIKLAG